MVRRDTPLFRPPALSDNLESFLSRIRSTLARQRGKVDRNKKYERERGGGGGMRERKRERDSGKSCQQVGVDLHSFVGPYDGQFTGIKDRLRFLSDLLLMLCCNGTVHIIKFLACGLRKTTHVTLELLPLAHVFLVVFGTLC